MRPTFVVSLDKELVWGSFDLMSAEAWARAYPDPRGTVRRLLALLDELAIPATWAVVGHLFLGACRRDAAGRAHPEIVRPRHAWRRGDWLADDPCTDRAHDPLWYGDDLVDEILAARTKHEVGSHSFSHVIYGDAGCSAEAAASDLAACVAAARARGVALRSFVFPRNVEGHHALLKANGFVAYRGDDPTWFRGLPGVARRAAHLFDQAAGLEPPVSVPRETLPGLWNIPGSMLLLHRGGVRQLVPLSVRVARGRAGLARAVREEKVFHLWFHPFNLCVDRAGMLGALREILTAAARLRDEGALDIRTMGDLADSMSHP